LHSTSALTFTDDGMSKITNTDLHLKFLLLSVYYRWTSLKHSTNKLEVTFIRNPRSSEKEA